ncbi:uncharacterized protein EI90DRAFT_2538824 [Cantharellus anzutake]|uniref:uncharacterized protein n=1 Tax=Cantharellus anzutake TaxID=1750568 RepID=UPI0019051648|nr:uncharacterized protein EI90DRAFT_2538824 [Cantharellus anzutake]KAF8338083.1 hypothetical protein EI90DRAFT_2538824 [Cantharellus anzutake]
MRAIFIAASDRECRAICHHERLNGTSRTPFGAWFPAWRVCELRSRSRIASIKSLTAPQVLLQLRFTTIHNAAHRGWWLLPSQASGTLRPLLPFLRPIESFQLIRRIALWNAMVTGAWHKSPALRGDGSIFRLALALSGGDFELGRRTWPYKTTMNGTNPGQVDWTTRLNNLGLAEGWAPEYDPAQQFMVANNRVSWVVKCRVNGTEYEGLPKPNVREAKQSASEVAYKALT